MSAMEALVLQLAEAKSQFFRLQNQLLKAHNRINDIVITQKRCEAELEEMDNLKDDLTVYKQVARMFASRTVSALRDEVKEEVRLLDEELPKLKELEKGLQKKLCDCQALCVELEDKLRAQVSQTSSSSSSSGSSSYSSGKDSVEVKS